MEWWKETIVYEVYPKSFKDTGSKGTGDLRGIIEKLDYLKSFGVGAIWITPVYKSPMVDNGYDIADYCSIDESYGTMDDMDELIHEAEKRGIKIVMDLVFNHTSDQHDWFIESRKSKDNPKSDWYIWRDPLPDGRAPTNWRGIFGGSVWTYCEERNQYFFHTFAEKQPDLNWENPEVRKALYKAANFWVDKGVGGFRIDAITYVKKPPFVNGTPDAEDGMVSVHDMTANTEGILDFLHEFKREVRDGHDIFTVGEANGVSANDLKDWVGETGVFDLLFEFTHVNIEFKGFENWCHPDEWELPEWKGYITASEESTRNSWYPVFFENHDRMRGIDHFFPAGCDTKKAGKALGLLNYTLRGTPFIYQGQELGYTNVAWDSIESYNDISSIGQYELALETGHTKEEAMKVVNRFSRDNARTPMQWDDTYQAGFTKGIPWLPIHDDYKEINVEAEDLDVHSVLNFYRQLSKLRNEHAGLISGDYKELMHERKDLYVFTRNNGEYIILINFTNDPITYDPSLTEEYECLLSNYNDSKKGYLSPLEAIIYRKQ